MKIIRLSKLTGALSINVMLMVGVLFQVAVTNGN